jgi:hypothetical protein
MINCYFLHVLESTLNLKTACFIFCSYPRYSSREKEQQLWKYVIHIDWKKIHKFHSTLPFFSGFTNSWIRVESGMAIKVIYKQHELKSPMSRFNFVFLSSYFLHSLTWTAHRPSSTKAHIDDLYIDDLSQCFQHLPLPPMFISRILSHIKTKQGGVSGCTWSCVFGKGGEGGKQAGKAQLDGV